MVCRNARIGTDQLQGTCDIETFRGSSKFDEGWGLSQYMGRA